MAKGNNTAENQNRGRLIVKCPKDSSDMDLVKVKGASNSGMYLVCAQCGNRIKYVRGIYKNYEHYTKV